MFCRITWVFLAAFIVQYPLFVPAQSSGCGATHYDCAVFYIQRHNFQQAIRSLNEELSQSPRNLKALNLLGIAFTGLGQLETAGAQFKQALRIDPRFYPARKNLAVNEFDGNHLEEAETQFNRVLKDAPDDAIVHLYLGEISFERKDLQAAMTHYEKGRSRITQKPSWILHYAQTALAVNHTEKAIAALKLLPANDAEDRFQAGLLLGSSNAYASAAEFFASARKHYSDPYTAGYNQLLMLTKAGSYAQGIELFDELIKEDPKRAELYNLVSESYVKTGKLQQAFVVLRTATQLEPQAEDNYIDLAGLCLEYENYPLGKEILDVGIHYIANSYRLYIQRGVTEVMKGSIVEAEKDFQTASNLAPGKSLPYYALGEVWIQSGQTEKAISVLREKSKLPGINFLVPYIFGQALIRAGAEPGTPAADEAIQALQKSIQLNTNFAHSHAELGKLLLKQGDLENAILESKAASALDPNDTGPVYVLAQAYRKKGEKDQADAMLARIAQLHSADHNLDVKRELKRLVKQDMASQTNP